MKHNPTDPAVQRSYDAYKSEVAEQFDYATKKLGITFEASKEAEPYKSVSDMVTDVQKNKHLFIPKVADLPTDHPLSELNPRTKLSYASMSRATHDLFGHVAEGFGLDIRGRENAWNTHRQMFSRAAVPAMTTETRFRSSIPEEKTSSEILVSDSDVLAHIEKIHDEEFVDVKRINGKTFELKDVDVGKIDSTTNDTFGKKQAEEYAKVDTPFPPIVSDNLKNSKRFSDVIDGNRRLLAAKLRGDKVIKAYVPVSKKIPTMTTETRSVSGQKAGLLPRDFWSRAEEIPDIPTKEQLQAGAIWYHGTGENWAGFTKEGGRGTATGNPTGELGTFFTKLPEEAQRYIKDFHGGKGKVIQARVKLKNPYYISISEFNKLTTPPDLTKPNWGELKNNARNLRKKLEAAGHDGIIIAHGAKYEETVVFDPKNIDTTPSMADYITKTLQDAFVKTQSKFQAPAAEKPAETPISDALATKYGQADSPAQ
ncbi:MAG: hypothetical protein AAB649_00225, partial [Patescibacteria group bacterium]